ncbi:MAG: hypothetical protein IPG91_19405, partial [Ideonella sp.]|nr:hypothetical protein [Ideonella sp.]
MPKAAAASMLVVVATKWRCTSVPPLARNQALAACALAIVSFGSKVCMATMNSRRRPESQLAQHGRDVVAVDVGDEVHCEAGLRKRVQRRHGHLCTEVAAADADVDDMPDAARGTVAHAFGEGEHCIEHCMHLGRDRVAHDRRRAQRGVQHRTAFGQVDRVAAQHRVAAARDIAFARQIGEPPAGASESTRFRTGRRRPGRSAGSSRRSAMDRRRRP